MSKHIIGILAFFACYVQAMQQPKLLTELALENFINSPHFTLECLLNHEALQELYLPHINKTLTQALFKKFSSELDKYFVRTLYMEKEGYIDKIMVSPDSKYVIVSMHYYNELYYRFTRRETIWEINTGNLINTLEDTKDCGLSYHSHDLNQIKVPPSVVTSNSKYLLSINYGLNIINIATGQLLRTFNCVAESLTLTPDNKYIVIGCQNKVMLLYLSYFTQEIELQELLQVIRQRQQ